MMLHLEGVRVRARGLSLILTGKEGVSVKLCGSQKGKTSLERTLICAADPRPLFTLGLSKSQERPQMRFQLRLRVSIG